MDGAEMKSVHPVIPAKYPCVREVGGNCQLRAVEDSKISCIYYVPRYCPWREELPKPDKINTEGQATEKPS